MQQVSRRRSQQTPDSTEDLNLSPEYYSQRFDTINLTQQSPLTLAMAFAIVSNPLKSVSLMARVPIYPPTAILSLLQHGEAGVEIVSVCSSDLGHQHVVSYDQQMALHGDPERDHAWRASLTCPICRAPGGGIIIRRKGD